MLNPKIYYAGLLPAVLIVEVVSAQIILNSMDSNSLKNTTYAVSGIVDNLFPKVPEARYMNIVSDGVVGEVVPDTKTGKPHQAITLNEKSLELRGVTITPDNKYALLWDKSKNKSVIAQEGDSIKSIKLISIYNDRVLVLESNKEKEIRLRKKTDK